MKKNYLSIAIAVLLSGCFINERGISNRYYDDCKPYYDASGTYYEECPTNWIDIPLTPNQWRK